MIKLEANEINPHAEHKGLPHSVLGSPLSYLAVPGRLLNIGCGDGSYAKLLHDMGHHVIGVDIDQENVEQARVFFPEIEFRVGNYDSLEFKDESFDYVLFTNNGIDFLYPLETRVTSMGEVYRVLHSGGCFIYASHDRNCLFLPTLRKVNRIRYFDGPYHTERTHYGDVVTYFGTPKNNMKQLEKAGFKGFEALPQDNPSWRYYVTWKHG